MKEQNKPLVRRYLRAIYIGAICGLLILVGLSLHQKNQILELERRVGAVAEEQERTLREAEMILDWLEEQEHDFEEGDPARGGEI